MKLASRRADRRSSSCTSRSTSRWASTRSCGCCTSRAPAHATISSCRCTARRAILRTVRADRTGHSPSCCGTRPSTCRHRTSERHRYDRSPRYRQPVDRTATDRAGTSGAPSTTRAHATGIRRDFVAADRARAPADEPSFVADDPGLAKDGSRPRAAAVEQGPLRHRDRAGRARDAADRRPRDRRRHRRDRRRRRPRPKACSGTRRRSRALVRAALASPSVARARRAAALARDVRRGAARRHHARGVRRSRVPRRRRPRGRRLQDRCGRCRDTGSSGSSTTASRRAAYALAVAAATGEPVARCVLRFLALDRRRRGRDRGRRPRGRDRVGPRGSRRPSGIRPSPIPAAVLADA